MTNPEQQSTTICLLVPCYNEAMNIPIFVEEAKEHLQNLDWHICFINDGSADNSWEVILKENEQDSRIHGLNFVRNFGHQNALKAGINEASNFVDADLYITLDADLQHPLEYIPDMILAWKEGHHIVQMQRQDEKRQISIFKKSTSKAFYRLFSWLSGINMQAGLSDFRLIDRDVMSFTNCAMKKTSSCVVCYHGAGTKQKSFPTSLRNAFTASQNSPYEK